MTAASMRAAVLAAGAALLAAVAGLAALAGPAALSAQTVRGVLLDASTGEPVAGAMVWLRAEDGRQLPAGLTGATGSFLLSAPGPGRYRVEGERIGYDRASSEPLTLLRGETVEHRLEIEVRAVLLEGITAEAGGRCQVRPEAGVAAARLWDEARKALAATAWTAEQEVFRFQLVRWRRELQPRSLRVLREVHRETQQGASANPIRSRPAEELQRAGWVQPAGGGGHLYFAPDAEVLLSDAFLDGHCFGVVVGEGAEEGLVGLAFRPVPGQRLPDVEGVLWLDLESAELRFMELGYTRYPYAVPTGDLGARVEFEGLASGAWIVRRWWIRMPQVGLESEWIPGQPPATSLRLQSVLEEGGELRGIQLRQGAVAERQLAVLEGVVVDSTHVVAVQGRGRAPGALEGAVVYLSGTGFSATTDAFGEFRMEGLPEGTYVVSFEHPRLDGLATNAVPVEVRLEAGEAAWAALTVPSPVSLVEGYCPDRVIGTGMLVGQVVDQEGRPVREAVLEVARSSYELLGIDDLRDIRERVTALEVPLDERARFRVCGVEGLLRIGVSVGGRPVLADTVRVLPDALVDRKLHVRRGPG